jgi:hypothetical protein
METWPNNNFLHKPHWRVAAGPWHRSVIGYSTMQASRLHLKCDGTRAETGFRLSAKRSSPFTSAGASVQSTTGSRAVRVSGINAGYTMFRGSVKSAHSIRHFPLHFPSRASPCVITFQLGSTYVRTFRTDLYNLYFQGSLTTLSSHTNICTGCKLC